MPLYTYTCENHGEFATWGRMSDSDAPRPCPSCDTPAPRAPARPAIGGIASDASACDAYAGCGEGMCGAPAPAMGSHVCGTGCVH